MQTISTVDLSNIKVLVAESNPRTRYIITALLSGYGVGDVDETADAIGALECYKEAAHDIIVADWDMPEGGGLQLTRAVRRSDDPAGQTVPIILVTAYTGKHRIAEARDAGVTEILCKPVSAKGLYLRLANVILYPKDTIKTPTFLGPDRRRFQSRGFAFDERRDQEARDSYTMATDSEVSSFEAQ